LGAGDILRFDDGGMIVDFTAIHDDLIKGIEVLDLNSDNGMGNEIIVSVLDMLSINDSDRIFIEGEADDTVVLSSIEGAWSQEADADVNGNTYAVYTGTGANGDEVTLYAANMLDVTLS